MKRFAIVLSLLAISLLTGCPENKSDPKPAGTGTGTAAATAKPAGTSTGGW